MDDYIDFAPEKASAAGKMPSKRGQKQTPFFSENKWGL
jgi:hypothetical protein